VGLLSASGAPALPRQRKRLEHLHCDGKFFASDCRTWQSALVLSDSAGTLATANLYGVGLGAGDD